MHLVLLYKIQTYHTAQVSKKIRLIIVWHSAFSKNLKGWSWPESFLIRHPSKTPFKTSFRNRFSGLRWPYPRSGALAIFEFMEKSGFLKRALLNVSDRELFIKLKLSIIPIIIIFLITVNVYWSSFNLRWISDGK